MALTMVASSLLFLAFLLQGSAYGDVCAGCPVEFDAKEDGSDKMVYQAFETINSYSANSLEVLRIVRATRQVVNGIKYSFDVEYTVNGVKPAETCKIEILSQPWTKEEPHVISQNCAEVKNELRQARQLLGGLRDVDESEMAMVKDLADFAVSTLDEIDTDNNKQIVNEIVEAKKQLVNGIMYHLTLRVKTTSCTEGSVSDPSDPCSDSQTGPAKLCKIQLHRSWADKSPLNAKVVKSECEEETRIATGGLRPVDVNDDSLNSITDFALEHINSMSNSMFMSGLVGLEKANYQVVAGMKYFLTMHIADTDCLKNSYQKGAKCNFVDNPSGKATCDIAVWVKPWENFMQVTSAKCNDKTFEGFTQSEKRSALMDGAPSEIDPNTQAVKELTQFSLNEMDKETNSIYRLAASRVIRVTSQVVAGTKYTIEMEVGESNCQKGVPTNSECTPNGETKTCSVEIWDRPWLNDRRVIKSTCNNIRRARQVGGQRPVGADSQEVRSQLGFVSNHVNEKVNSANYLTITRVISATSQVVAGTSTRITFGIAETNCDRRVPADLSRCQVAANSPERVCRITIWDQPWLGKKSVTDFNCGGTNSKGRRRRGLSQDFLMKSHRRSRSPDEEGYVTGLADEVDPKSYNVVRMIKYFLNEMDKKTHSEYKLGVYTIHKAVLRVVAGEKLAVSMSIGESSCKKGDSFDKECTVENPTQYCNVTLMDWTWMNKIEILNQQCESIKSRSGRSAPGSPKEVNVNDMDSEELKDLKNFVSSEITKRANSLNTKRVVRIVNTTNQVVSGSLTQLTVIVGETVCLKSENKLETDCELKSDNEQDHQVCSVVIWEQPWLGKREVQSAECHNIHQSVGSLSK